MSEMTEAVPCFCSFILAFLSFSHSVDPSTPGRLLVVSFDGLRNDYFDRPLSTPNFHRLTSGSALYRRRVENVFPTQTFPNHFSISTGRYAEEHGVLASEVWDAESGSILSYGPSLFHYDPQILPIWTLNEKFKRRSGCMMWPGCDMPYGGVNVTYFRSWNVSTSWEERVGATLTWFKDPKKPADLVMLYFESPDMEEHIYGPNSPQTNKQIERADSIVGMLLTALAEEKLKNINVVLLSDHGMEPVTLPRIYNLTDVLSKRGRAVGTSPVLQIYPKKGKMDELYAKLKSLSANQQFDVYLKKDVPDHFRYKNCRRAPPILAVARPQYAFQDMYTWIDSYRRKYNLTVTNKTEFGVHGYDPKFPSMQPFVIALGPKFKNLSQLPEKIVDLYGVFADVLGLERNGPSMSPDAALWSRIPVESNEPTIEIVFFSLASIVGLTTIYVVFVIFKRRHSARNLGYALVEKDETGV